MRIRRIVLYAVSTLLLINCNSVDTAYTGMPDTSIEKVDFEIIDNAFQFARPSELLICGDTLVVYDDKLDKLIHLFNKESGKHIGSFINKGRGPGEATFFNSIFCDNNQLYGIDPNQKKLIVLDLRDNKITEYTTVGIAGWPTRILPYKDGKILLYSSSETYRFAIYDLQSTKIISSYNIYPLIDENEQTVRSIFNYAGQYAMTPYRDKIVIATYVGSILETLDINDDIITSSHCNYYFEPKYDYQKGTVPPMVKPIDKTIIGFEDIFVSNEHIYGLVWNRSYKDIKSEKFKSRIIVFDMSGQPEWGIENNNGKIKSFIIDENPQMIYAIIRLDGESKLARYALGQGS